MSETVAVAEKTVGSKTMRIVLFRVGEKFFRKMTDINRTVDCPIQYIYIPTYRELLDLLKTVQVDMVIGGRFTAGEIEELMENHSSVDFRHWTHSGQLLKISKVEFVYFDESD